MKTHGYGEMSGFSDKVHPGMDSSDHMGFVRILRFRVDSVDLMKMSGLGWILNSSVDWVKTSHLGWIR